MIVCASWTVVYACRKGERGRGEAMIELIDRIERACILYMPQRPNHPRSHLSSSVNTLFPIFKEESIHALENTHRMIKKRKHIRWMMRKRNEACASLSSPLISSKLKQPLSYYTIRTLIRISTHMPLLPLLYLLRAHSEDNHPLHLLLLPTRTHTGLSTTTSLLSLSLCSVVPQCSTIPPVSRTFYLHSHRMAITTKDVNAKLDTLCDQLRHR